MTIELSLIERDASGNPTGKTIEYSAESGSKIWEFWNKNKGKKKKRRRKTKAASAKEAEKILKELYTGD